MHRWTSCDPNLVLMGTLDLDVLSMSRYLDGLTRPPTYVILIVSYTFGGHEAGIDLDADGLAILQDGPSRRPRLGPWCCHVRPCPWWFLHEVVVALAPFD